MANTRKDHKAMLRLAGREPEFILVEIPNKIARRFRQKSRKKHSGNTWEILRRFHPKLFFSLIEKMRGRK